MDRIRVYDSGLWIAYEFMTVVYELLKTGVAAALLSSARAEASS